VAGSLQDAGKAGINGTPSFLIGYPQADGAEIKSKKLIRGAVGYDIFKKTIDELLTAKH
jgi:predicted DsbA family dithiol-disulfide isomerase